MRQLIISIVAFNTRDLLKKCLNNVYSQEYKDFEVWVLDNNSIDGSVQMVEKEFPQVKLIKNNQNTGFSKGQNTILKKSKGDFYLLLNPDTRLREDTLEKMLEFMKSRSECGIASCQITDFSGTIQSNGGDLPIGLALFSWLYNLEFFKRMPSFHKQVFSKEAIDMGWVGGAFMLVRSEVFQKIGFLNEDYFMYFEDVEFCYKAHKAGFKVMLNPEVSVAHKSGASSKDPHFFQWSREFAGLLYFYKKNFGMAMYWIVKLLIWKAIILRIIAYSILGKFKVSKTYVKILPTI